ncbi:superoxide dismutase family protein [Neobacillus massiliamazoniensis]|uniref:Superoxide dismutase [Cu-Zn] n=1 Tax=Neobacillus massiliamazoniensis TaxID=1499688 RepID=A0A0U1NUH3_9BACI|nr:superoxide dismutase family protein [Neobacillus massiliamazoniensis]CRK81625.1 copper/zinc superoxide dismutase [Neobacillus massiliamazoniensis]
MKKGWIILPLFLLVGCTGKNITQMNVGLFNAVGDSVGSVTLTEQSSGVKMAVKVNGLSPGIHAIHIHEKGKCIAPDFKSAGNHFNPEGKDHGLLNPKGAHAGDLPNLIAQDDGSAKAELMAPNVTLRDGKKSLFTKAGTSIVITAQKDDGMTQPSGNSGKRIACGEISKLKKGQREAQEEKR